MTHLFCPPARVPSKDEPFSFSHYFLCFFHPNNGTVPTLDWIDSNSFPYYKTTSSSPTFSKIWRHSGGRNCDSFFQNGAASAISGSPLLPNPFPFVDSVYYVNGEARVTESSINTVRNAEWNAATNDKWRLIDWPKEWNAPPNSHGTIQLTDPYVDAFVFQQEGAPVTVTETKEIHLSNTFSLQFEFDKPETCSLDVSDDNRCDDARSTV